MKEAAGEEERRPRSHHHPRAILLHLFRWCGTSRTGSALKAMALGPSSSMPREVFFLACVGEREGKRLDGGEGSICEAGWVGGFKALRAPLSPPPHHTHHRDSYTLFIDPSKKARPAKDRLSAPSNAAVSVV